MVLADRGDEVVGEERLRGDAGRRVGGEAGDCGVELAVGDGADQLVRAALAELQLDAAVLGVERREDGGERADEGIVPTATRPWRSPVCAATAARTSRAAASAARACGRTASPTGVRRTARVVRSSSRSPSSSSSRRTCALMPGWATWSRAAARVNEASSTTVTKYSSCRSSISADSR